MAYHGGNAEPRTVIEQSRTPSMLEPVPRGITTFPDSWAARCPSWKVSPNVTGLKTGDDHIAFAFIAQHLFNFFRRQSTSLFLLNSKKTGIGSLRQAFIQLAIFKHLLYSLKLFRPVVKSISFGVGPGLIALALGQGRRWNGTWGSLYQAPRPASGCRRQHWGLSKVKGHIPVEPVLLASILPFRPSSTSQGP